jgi:hypothetical protein
MILLTGLRGRIAVGQGLIDGVCMSVGGGTRHAHGLHWAKIARPALSNAGCVDLTYILLEGSIHTTRALAWAYLDSQLRGQGKEHAGARDTLRGRHIDIITITCLVFCSVCVCVCV